MGIFKYIRKRNEPLFYFWRGYLLFGILLFVCMLPLCVKSFLLLEENVQKNAYKNMEKGMELLDNEIATLYTTVLEIQSDKNFADIRAIEGEYKTSDYYAFIKMKQKLSNVTKTLSFAKNSMLYFPQDLIFFHDNVYTIEAQDSSKRLYTASYGRLEEWFDELDDQKNKYAFLKADKYFDSVEGDFYGIPYVHTYVRSNHEENPLFVTIFPVQTLMKLWHLEDLREIANITVSNGKDGDVLYTEKNNDDKWSNEIVVNSKKSKICVTVSIPNHYYISQLSELIWLGVVYVCVFLLLAVVISVRMAYKNTQKHTELYQEISHWMLREHILNGLEGRQLEEFQDRYQKFPSPFRLAIIHVTQTEWSIPAAEVKELLAEYRINYWFFSKIKPNRFVMLCAGELEIVKLRENLEQFIKKANEKWDCDCIVSMGKKQDSLNDLNEIYLLVRCNMKCFEEQKLMFHEDVEGYEEDSQRDMNVLENIRLTDIILNGNEEVAIDLIKKQWENVKAVRADAVLKQLFFMQSTVLTSVATKLGHDISGTNMTYDDSISVIEAKMIRVTKQLCELVNRKKEEEKDDVPKRIIAFIEENYNDPNLYMTTLVDEFELSDKTIAKLIKKHQNKSFSEFLEELRIQKALQLLNNPANSIKYVARESGFSSENTFFKVFKRRFGVSPSNYRSNKQIMTRDETTENIPS